MLAHRTSVCRQREHSLSSLLVQFLLGDDMLLLTDILVVNYNLNFTQLAKRDSCNFCKNLSNCVRVYRRRLLVHLVKNGCSSCVVCTVDTDVVIILIGKFFSSITYHLTIAFGAGKAFSYFHSTPSCILWVKASFSSACVPQFYSGFLARGLGNLEVLS